MNADVVTAAATIAEVVVAGLVGAGGLVVGVVGLVQANKAKRRASEANTIAAEANDISKEANALALKATEIIAEQADRDTERSDVAWEWQWDDDYPEHVIVQNIGKGLAKEVVVQFFFEKETLANDPLDVEGRRSIRLEVPGLAARRKESLDLDEINRLGGMAGYEPSDRSLTARVRLRVTWLTPKRTPKLHDTGFYDASLSGDPH